MGDAAEDKSFDLFQSHTQLSEDFYSHRTEAEGRWGREDKRYEQLMESIERNTESVGKLVEETRAVVQLHRDVEGVKRVGTQIQKFALWVAKWPVIGAGLYAIYEWGKKFMV